MRARRLVAMLVMVVGVAGAVYVGFAPFTVTGPALTGDNSSLYPDALPAGGQREVQFSCGYSGSTDGSGGARSAAGEGGWQSDRGSLCADARTRRSWLAMGIVIAGTVLGVLLISVGVAPRRPSDPVADPGAAPRGAPDSPDSAQAGTGQRSSRSAALRWVVLVPTVVIAVTGMYVALALAFPMAVPRVAALPPPAAETTWSDGCNDHTQSWEQRGPFWVRSEFTTTVLCVNGP